MSKALWLLAGAFAMAVIAFGIIAALRIDSATIALLSGTAIGLLVGVPCASFITWLVCKEVYTGGNVYNVHRDGPIQPRQAAPISFSYTYVFTDAPPHTGEVLTAMVRDMPYEQARQMIADGRVRVIQADGD